VSGRSCDQSPLAFSQTYRRLTAPVWWSECLFSQGIAIDACRRSKRTILRRRRSSSLGLRSRLWCRRQLGNRRNAARIRSPPCDDFKNPFLHQYSRSAPAVMASRLSRRPCYQLPRITEATKRFACSLSSDSGLWLAGYKISGTVHSHHGCNIQHIDHSRIFGRTAVCG
jgi:hypothetical protein